MARLDPVHNWVERGELSLDALFQPRRVAVIGAKDDIGTVGRTLLTNLAHFPGEVFPVNPKRETVLGRKCYKELPDGVDLAVIVTPSHTVPGVVASCVEKGVKGCIVISSGFKELGAAGKRLEDEVVKAAQGIPMIGPNCLGVMNPLYGMNATFAKGMAHPGHLAFISQSGAMCTSVLDWSLTEGIGFSAFVSIGSMADTDWGDLILYLGDDPNTQAILLYMETVGNARNFLSAAREVALEKPIIVIKGGKTEESAHAAASHTGSLAGSDQVFEAALERAGVLRVNSISELFSLAQTLAYQKKPKGPRLAIVTNAGGPSVLATDATVLKGATMAKLSADTIASLDSFLPAAWSRANPVDILGDARAKTYVQAVDEVIQDPENDGVLVILTPQDMTEPNLTAEGLKPYAKGDKPLLASWMGGDTVQGAIKMLNQAHIPNFPYPDDAATVFAMMWNHTQSVHRLYETPSWNGLGQDQALYEVTKTKADQLIASALAQNRVLLDEKESKELLEIWGIPTVQTWEAKSEEEAVKYAEAIGYPVVLKLVSHQITHKTDVGGVRLNLTNKEEVAAAYRHILAIDGVHAVSVQKMVKHKGYELILGSSIDPQFGPVLLFGTGGSLVEIYQDTALALPPLNTNLTKLLLEKTKVYKALQGTRGQKRVNIEELEKTIVRFSDMITAHPNIQECDINPFLIGEESMVALDARVVLTPHLGHTQLAIRPYPVEYSWQEQTKAGKKVFIRLIRPTDANKVIRFHEQLSEESVKHRFLESFSMEKRTNKGRLLRICSNDYNREWALVAEIEEEIVGIARLSKVNGKKSSLFKMVIADAYQGQGLGKKLLKHLVDIAKNESIEVIEGIALKENQRIQKLATELGFTINPYSHELVTLKLQLNMLYPN